MAGDWIKMRVNLWDDPRIASLVEATDSSEAAVIGALYWLWCAADQHSQDGNMCGLTLKQLDRKVVLPGFAAGLVAIGWIAATETGLRIERFNEHNGASAKNRMTTAKRVAAHRDRSGNDSSNAATVTVSGTTPLAAPYLDTDTDLDTKAKATVQQTAHDEPVPDKLPDDIKVPEAPKPMADCAPTEAKPKRIVGKQQTAEFFPAFWAAHPVKKGKVNALKKWKLKGLDEIADKIIAHFRMMEREDDDWKRGFIPHAITYINGELWNDEPKRDKPVTAPAPPPETFGAKAALQRTESKLDTAVAHIRHQLSLGAYGDGEAAEAEASRLIAEARQKHGESGDANRG